jgi:hypothetical protein
LSGTAPTGFQSFATAFGASPVTVAYCIADQTGNNWEVGTGVFNGTTGLTRVTVLGSSNGGSLVNFTSGTKDVFCTAPAKYLDLFTSTNQGTVAASGGGTSNFLRADGSWAAPYSGSPLPIANGGTAATTSNGAFNKLSGYTVNNSVGVSLDTTSTYNQFCIGSSGGVTLPDVTTIPLGYTYHVVNQTTTAFSVDAFNNDPIATIPINTGMLFTCIRITAPQETAWIYATSDLWSTSDGSSAGNTGITGTGASVHTSGATLSNVANLSTSGPTLLQNGSGSLSIDDGGSTASTLRIIGQTATLGRNRIYSAPLLRITTSSTNPISFHTGASLATVNSDGVEQFRVSNTASAVNYVQITGGVTGTPGTVTVSAQGANTDVNLALTPKGTGTVRFGTYTAGIVAQAGYVTITDAGGTSRRLLVG